MFDKVLPEYLKLSLYIAVAWMTLISADVKSGGSLNVEKANAERPNILLVVSEDHSPHLSGYGDTVVQTDAHRPFQDVVEGRPSRTVSPQEVTVFPDTREESIPQRIVL